MLIEAPITKENFFLRGTYGRTYRRTEGEGGGLTCHASTLSHLKSFLEPAVPPIRLFLMINMMPIKKCVVKGNYFTALLRNEARNKFLL